MKKAKINNLKCQRCGYKWAPRIIEVRICPRCKSPYWDIKKKNKK